MYIAYSNLLSVQNIFNIYASGISFWPFYHVEHNGAISIQNGARMKEIKYFLESYLLLKSYFSGHLLSYYFSNKRSIYVRSQDLENLTLIGEKKLPTTAIMLNISPKYP